MMTGGLRRARPFLTTLPSSDPSRATRDLLRKSTAKFFLPFVQPRRSSPDLAAYRFRENLSNVLIPDIIDSGDKLTHSPSTSGNGKNINNSGNGINGRHSTSRRSSFLSAAQLNGEVGDSRLFEDLFHIILAGFDVVYVNVENKGGCSMTSCVQDPCHFRGFLILAHTRPFLGWTPSFIEMHRSAFLKELNPSHQRSGVSEEAHSRVQLHTHDLLPFVTHTEDKVLIPMTIKVPFSTHAEGSFTKGGSSFLLSHLNLRLRLVDALCADPLQRETFGIDGNRLAAPPAPVVAALNDKEARVVFAGLRRLGVRPECITAETILAAKKQKTTDADVLGAL